MSNIQYHFKVDNPNLSNEVPQMKSEHLQPRFYFGSDIRYKLNDDPPPPTKFKSTKLKIANLR